MHQPGKLAALFILAFLAGCGGGSSTPANQIVPIGRNITCVTAPMAIHQGKNTLLLEGDALSVRAFAPGFSSLTRPAFSFPFTVPGATASAHPRDLATDASGHLYVDVFDDALSGIAIYDHVPGCANTNVLPDAVLTGPHTGLGSTYSLAIDSLGRLYVANIGSDGESQISIFAAGASGDVAPIATIRGDKTLLGAQSGTPPGFTKSVRVDSNFNVYTANSIGQIAVFSAGSTGNVAPSRIIAGDKTHLVDPVIALGSDDSIYAANFEGNSITVYPPGANGNVSPTRIITGGNTHVRLPFAVAVCSDGTLYVAANGILTFNPNSDGNVAPRSVVSDGNSGVFQPIALGF